ncbi:ubiquitin carboxyl-terminal hydrolase 9X-like isoform X4 [Chanodichthys erythropterus]|uniref:ubiquitin carboxyl-terminal hydrolase 9X-like isoform X4 n=1 Tax=Chanodichthys erythropterus TaxID=933992 RepID=UPI00351DD08A
MTATTRGSPVGGNESQSQAPDGQNQTLLPQNQTPSPNSSNETSPISPPEEPGQGEAPPAQEEEEPAFPHADLAKLDDMINRPRWVVPVLPKGELEVLLEAAIDLSKKGLDVRCEACQRFFRDGLTISFTKILTDEAVSGWKFEIHRCIINNTHRLIELCVVKLAQDWFPLLELLAMATNPHCKFHIYNGTRPSESVPAGAQLADDELFARPPDPRSPKGWLVDLINKFGTLNGFQILHDRFMSVQALNVQIIAALIKPFGQCYEFLTLHTVKKFFSPVIEMVPQFLENLTDEELKKEAKNEAKNDALSMIIKSLKNLASRVPGQEETVKNLEIFRLKMILRLLQISSFNGKMNALNEVNKVISSVSYYTHRHGNPEEEEWLTAERMAEWIQQNHILSIVLRDSLHQPQYVEKLEKILRFVIKEKALTLQDLDSIWAAQAGKHEAIVKNVHDLLAKLAWDFSPEQLDHLFDCFKASWTNASKKQREKLLELIRRLAEDDKDGVMAHKVLNLLWNLAHSDDVPVDIMDQALSAHIKILDYSCSQDRDTQKMQWIDRFIEELRTNDKWVIPALKQIREICSLFGEAPQNVSQTQRSPHVFYRHDLINQLQHNHALVTLVAENLSAYMENMRQFSKENPGFDPQTVRVGSRYSHVQEVQERLNFLRFLLKDGQLWLCAPQAKQIWKCLAENAVFLCDREACFKWYSKLMGDEPDLDPDINKDFFENNVLQLDPTLLTENGMKCFERFFKAVNCREGKLVAKRRAYMMDDLELIGLDYLWRVVIQGSDDIATRAIDLLKEIYTNLGPKLQANQVEIHEDFIQSCFDRLKASYDTLCVLDGDKDSINCARQEAIRMVRVLTVLKEYINECDSDYHEERTILPMSRAFRGKHISLVVRFPNQGRQVDDLDIWSHTNDTIGSVRRCILNRIKANSTHTKVELFIGGEIVDPADDRRLIGQLNLKDKALITAKLTQVSSNMPSSPDSSSDSSTGSPGNHGNHYSDGPNPEVESCLPGVIMSLHLRYISFLWQIADLGCTLNMPLLRDGARVLMKLMPPDTTTVENLRAICLDHAKLGENSLSPTLDSRFFGPSPSQVLYLTEVVYALLMPATGTLGDDACDFQFNFLKSGGLPLVLGMLTRNNFLPNADMETRRGAYLNALKIAKLMLTAIGFGHVKAVAEACQPVVEGTNPASPINQATHDQALVLQNALQSIPNPASECMLRNVAIRLAQQISDENFFQASKYIPDICVIRAVQKIVWASGCGMVHLVFSSNEEISKIYEKTNAGNEPDAEDEQVCCEALEVMTLCFALLPTALDTLSKEKAWQTFIIDLLLHCQSKAVRQMAQEQFFLMATRCCMGHRPLLFFITLLFTVLGSTAKERAKHAGDYFTLLRHLLNYAYNSNINLPNAEVLLNNEIDWLKRIRDEVKRTSETGVEETILEGHLGVTKELLAFQTPEKKFYIGCEKGGANLIKELIDDFIFPASNVYLQYVKSGEFPAEQAIPVCSSPASINAGFELLVALAVGCVRNLKQIVDTLTDMYYLGQDHLLPEAEEIAMISIQLAARFLFSTGFHTKKVVRGPASDWYDALCILLRYSKNVRSWFAHNVLFAFPTRFSEYLLECPSAEVRGAFAKLIVFIAHFSLQDGPCPAPVTSPGTSTQACDSVTLSDHLLRAVLNLLRREVSEHGRHLQQYFNLFVMYANLGLAEKTQLLKLSVPSTFMLVALDEGPGPPIKYQYAELGKLYTVVSQLLRCCDVSSRMQSSINGNPPLANPYGDPNLAAPIMPLQQLVAEILFVRTSYVKKIIEDCSNSEETVKLLRFCCWENPQFSSTVLSELLWQVAYSYTYELRPYLDLLLQILLIEDSWQTHRIHNVLKGIPDDRDGLFDTIQRSKNHYQKRAYQCIKCMVALFTNCSVAYQILQSNGDLKRKWTWAVEWLGDELERRPYTGNPQYSYNNWSPPVQSNETSNGYFLERSHSARMTLAKACELCPEEVSAQSVKPHQNTVLEPDDQEAPDEHDSSPPEDTALYPHSPGTQYQQPNNHPHGQPYTGPAAQHMNNPQRPPQRPQESWEGTDEVPPVQTKE